MKTKQATKTILFLFLFLLLFLSIILQTTIAGIIRLDEEEQRTDPDFLYLYLEYKENPLDVKMDDLISRFESIHQELRHSDSYIFYEFNIQPLYNNGKETALFFDMLDGSYSDAKNGIPCVQISENVQNDFQLSALEGSLLAASDYVFDGASPIPVLMGYADEQTYHVGDQFTLTYLFQDYTFEVIGFLEKDTAINMQRKQVNLDQYIIMPSFQPTNSPNSETEYVSTLIHSMNRSNGTLKMPEQNYEMASKSLNAVLEKSDFGEYSYYTSSTILNYQKQGMDIQLIQTLSLWVGILTLLAAVVAMLKFYNPLLQKTASGTLRVSFLLTSLLSAADGIAILAMHAIVYRLGYRIVVAPAVTAGIVLMIIVFILCGVGVRKSKKSGEAASSQQQQTSKNS